MVLEMAVLNLREGQGEEFEATFKQASLLIASIDGYISHTLHRCLETPDRYLLLVEWETLEAHTIGFRESDIYQEWKALLHHFYDPFPTVEHFVLIYSNQNE
jgi:heme-degrading monooxygenase HmoA